MMTKTAAIFKDFNLESILVKTYRRIDPATRNIFFTAIGVNILAWFIFYAHHPLHNHVFRMPWIDWNEQSYLGRWFNRVVLRIIHAADIPTFLPLLSSILAVAAALITLRVWRLNLSAIERFLIVGMISVFPFFLSFYYYTWITPLFMSSCLFAASSLAICTALRPTPIIMGGFLFMLMMASYQTALSTYATIAAASVVIDLTRAEHKHLRNIAMVALARIIAAAVGGLGYLASLKILQVGSTHATRTIDLAEFPERVIDVSKAALEHLSLTQPEFHTPLKLVLLSVLILAFLASLWMTRSSPLRLALILFVWGGLILATKAMFFISADSNFYQYRYNSSMAFLYAFGAAFALHSAAFHPYRSLLLICVAFILLRFVQVDLIRQEVLLRGQQHDLAIANRILDRVESLPEFDASKTYDFVRIGKYSKFREEIHSSKGRNTEIYGDGHMDHGEIADRWADEQVMILLGSRIKFKNTGFDPDFMKKMQDFREKYAGKRKKWPHGEAVFIEDDTIYVYMN